MSFISRLNHALRCRLSSSANPTPRALCRAVPLLHGNPSSSSSSSGVEKRMGSEEESEAPATGGDLRARIFQLRFPKRSATAALERWVADGGVATAPELRRITRELRRAQRFKHALETCEWMINHRKGDLVDCDYADRIDLITKVFGVNAAEEFFEGLPSTARTSEAYTALLHSFARAKMVDRAENFFKRMIDSGLALTALSYNEMMTLYISAGLLDKVAAVAEELQSNNVSPDLFTYNLRISACAANMNVGEVRTILDEMCRDSNFSDGWKTYSMLTEVYISASYLVSAENTLVESHKELSQRDWITYDFLIILHSALGNKDRINEIWKSLQMTSQKMTSRNYICALSSYLVLGHLKEAGEIIDQWKRSKSLNFDISSYNRLLDALVKVGLNSTAEILQQMMIQKDSPLQLHPAHMPAFSRPPHASHGPQPGNFHLLGLLGLFLLMAEVAIGEEWEREAN